MEQLLTRISIMLVPALMAVTVHEVAHGWMADRFGDPTARLSGRITLNPFRHLDPIGTLALLAFGFGWARPVPVLFTNLRNPRRDMVLVSLAGPGANILLAIGCALVLQLLGLLPETARLGYLAALWLPVSLMIGFGLYINLILALFNLIPIPPLDGGRVLIGLMPSKIGLKLVRFEPFGFLLVIVLMFFTGLWQNVFYPVVTFFLEILAGNQINVLQLVETFLFGGDH